MSALPRFVVDGASAGRKDHPGKQSGRRLPPVRSVEVGDPLARLHAAPDLANHFLSAGGRDAEHRLCDARVEVQHDDLAAQRLGDPQASGRIELEVVRTENLEGDRLVAQPVFWL